MLLKQTASFVCPYEALQWTPQLIADVVVSVNTDHSSSCPVYHNGANTGEGANLTSLSFNRPSRAHSLWIEGCSPMARTLSVLYKWSVVIHYCAEFCYHLLYKQIEQTREGVFRIDRVWRYSESCRFVSFLWQGKEMFSRCVGSLRQYGRIFCYKKWNAYYKGWFSSEKADFSLNVSHNRHAFKYLLAQK